VPAVAERPRDELTVAVLGLGEAGAALAADLVSAGADVRGHDPDSERRVSGVRLATSAGEAVNGADVVLSVNAGGVAVAVAEAAAAHLHKGQLYADLNTASPATKAAVADVVSKVRAGFADVALLAPVPGRGVRTPALVSGTGAEAFAARFRPLGMPVEVVGREPGQAAERKLLRSVFMKGVAAAMVESLAAAEAAGCSEWLRGEIVAVLENADEALLDRLVTGSRLHAKRRVDEMQAAAELLRGLGIEPHVAEAAAASLAGLLRATDQSPSGAPSSQAAPRA
jgi:3-hydroxyisobutyrate dehydrogenase-like beta-hydroxyacid dehydrogenase